MLHISAHASLLIQLSWIIKVSLVSIECPSAKYSKQYELLSTLDSIRQHKKGVTHERDAQLTHQNKRLTERFNNIQCKNQNLR